VRKSSTSVAQFHLGNILEEINEGGIALPEFQRDFDWGVRDIKSLLATVFSGWPAGSLLLLENGRSFFELRPMEGAPPLGDVEFSVLDGQQRLTSLYHALYEQGKEYFAIQWVLASTVDDIEEAIVSLKGKATDKIETLQAQLENELIPLRVLQSPTMFFKWRDEILEVASIDKRENLKKILTDVYTYKLSAIHDYEFPVVKINKRVPMASVARIFEKVNRTGMTLNTFDLMVAKSFERGWNLRDEWNRSREEYPNLQRFFGDDGLPLLQAIALLEKEDVRQSAVLELSKRQVQSRWREVSQGASRVVELLRDSCGVARRDLMPYFNMLPVMVALECLGLAVDRADRFSRWFWISGFSAIYDAAANTRLVSHFKTMKEGGEIDFSQLELRPLEVSEASKKSNKAAWNAVNCAMLLSMEREAGRFDESLIEDIQVSQLFALNQIEASWSPLDDDGAKGEFRAAVNSFLVPKRFMRLASKKNAAETIKLLRDTEFRTFCDAQLQRTGWTMTSNWRSARAERERWISEFVDERGLATFVRVGHLLT